MTPQFYDIIDQTPLQYHEQLSKKYDCNLYIKREDLHPVRSFKIRGALYKILQLNDTEKQRGIVCASAGNHAQGVAFSCNKLDIDCDIFLPKCTPLQKINRIKHFNPNCSLHITGNTFDECLQESLLFSDTHNKTFIHPYNDRDVIKGQGTIMTEIISNLPDINVIIAPIGGGGLISGLVTVNSENKNKINIIGVEPEQCPSMKESIYNKQITTIDNTDTFVDGATVNTIGDITFDICKDKLKNIITVNNGQICEQMIDFYQNDGIVTEPAGIMSITSLQHINPEILKDKNVVCILSGGNNDIMRYPEILNKMLIHQNKRHYYIIKFSQRPGQLKEFIINILGETDDIIRFEYLKKGNNNFANIFIGIEVLNPIDIKYFEERLSKEFTFKKIDDDDILFDFIV